MFAALAQIGCSALQTPRPGDEQTQAIAASETGEEGVRYRLDVDAPPALRTLLEKHLDLARYQAAPDAGSITPFELNRLVAAAPAQARSLLETEGYFSPQIEVARAAGPPPVVRIAVTPGARTTIDRVTIDVQGALGAALEEGAAAARETLDDLREAWPLPKGEAFTQSAWTNAKNSTLARLRAEGYPSAVWSGTGAQIDPATHSARLFVVADSGPLYRLGELRIEGLERYDESVLRNLQNFGVGTPYREASLAQYQERLLKAGLFEAVTVELETDPALAAAAPVTVRVRELPEQQATAGIGASANTGPRVSLAHKHRRAFGRRLTASNEFEIGRDLRSWEGELITHPLPDLYRNLIAGNVERLAVLDEVRTSWRARIGRTQDGERIDRLYFAELLGSDIRNAALSMRAQAATLNYHWTWRRLDSVLLPTDGVTISTELAGGFARSNFADSGPFGRGVIRLTGYRPLPGGWYGQARVEGGDIFAADSIGVPDLLLFRAGGDDSVRGYAFRSLGPIRGGIVTSGRKLFTSSVEAARPISPRLPSVWWAAFVDAGNAANEWGELTPALGYGLGVRWRSPVGPLRADLAYGQEVRRVRLHISVGIAF